MRPFHLKVLCCIGLLIGSIIMGCGSDGDLLDTVGGRYDVEVVFDDGGESEDRIDILQSNCDGNTTSSEDDEDFYATEAIITVSVDEDSPGLTLDRYTIEYLAVNSPTGDNVIQTPPALLNPGTSLLSWHIEPGTSEDNSVPVISIDTKEDYRDLIGYVQDPSTLVVLAAPSLTNAYYIVRLTLYFTDDYGEEVVHVVTRTVLFGPWDNC